MRVPEMFSDHGMFMFLYALMDGLKVITSKRFLAVLVLYEKYC